MLQQLPRCALFSEFDWQPVRQVYQQLNELIHQGGFNQYMSYEPAYRANMYSIHCHGCVIESHDLTQGTPWRTWTGELLEHVIPWAPILKQRLVQSGLLFINFSYFMHAANISRHIDGKTDQEQCPGHCNINHVVTTNDQDSFTWTDTEEGQELHHTHRGSTWLLDTTKPHGVSNSGRREVFQIKFHSPYHDVLNFLDCNPSLFNVNDCGGGATRRCHGLAHTTTPVGQ